MQSKGICNPITNFLGKDERAIIKMSRIIVIDITNLFAKIIFMDERSEVVTRRYPVKVLDINRITFHNIPENTNFANVPTSHYTFPK